MAWARSRPMSHKVSHFVKMTKSDFVFEAERRGFSVETVKHKRDGWNDSRQFFAVRGDERIDCGEVMKGGQNDWNAAFDSMMSK